MGRVKENMGRKDRKSERNRDKKQKRRTAVILTALVLLWNIFPMQTLAQEGEEPALYATAAVLMDADSGRILYEKNGGDVMAMASTTKIMTCIVALENGCMEDSVEISSYAASMPKVKLYMRKGEQYLMGDLIRSLMLESHNDSAVAIAEHIGGQGLESRQEKSAADCSVEESKQAVAAFASLMNQKARDIGCEDTWFITPNGLDATETITLENGETVSKEHSTTAGDLARIMAYCIEKSPKKEEFLEITRTASHAFSANGRSFSCNNHNAFLQMMEGALSGKTGFTNKAGYCYVGALERDGKTLVVALLACGWPNHKTYKWSDTKELMQYGLDRYTYHSFFEAALPEETLQPIPVADGQTDFLGDEAYTGVRIAERETKEEAGNGQLEGILLREDEEIEVSYEMRKALCAPVEAGTVVGAVFYRVDGEIYKTETIVTRDSVGKADLTWCMRQIWKRFAV